MKSSVAWKPSHNAGCQRQPGDENAQQRIQLAFALCVFQESSTMKRLSMEKRRTVYLECCLISASRVLCAFLCAVASSQICDHAMQQRRQGHRDFWSLNWISIAFAIIRATALGVVMQVHWVVVLMTAVEVDLICDRATMTSIEDATTTSIEDATTTTMNRRNLYWNEMHTYMTVVMLLYCLHRWCFVVDCCGCWWFFGFWVWEKNV